MKDIEIEDKIVENKLFERLESISFWKLLSECTKIEIPIIQRDYAQGREDEKTVKIRGLFLDRLIKAIESENESLELDFVYGDIKNGIFQPLDGQQRLTTLFLLYWYFAYKTGNLSENKEHFKKFTYETRISSREFCNELVEKGEKLGEGETLREKITDASWFFLSWGKDPTIKAMLVMLDSIDSKLKSKSPEELAEHWRKLISENPPITFRFKPLNNIGLTDDLYIKMNARGKALTDFENFKARFEKHIKENEFEKNLSLTKDTFSHRIDTVWTDLFWKYRGDDNSVDNEFVKFIAGIAINSYAEKQEIFKSEEEDNLIRKILEEKEEKNITDKAVIRERIERRITLLFNNPNGIIPEDFPTKESFDYLISCFNIYLKYDELKPEKLDLWNFLEKNLFRDFIEKEKTEYKPRVLFYAQTQYLLKVKDFNSESFAKWMRVVRNIVQNATIDSAAAYIGAIGLINELSSGCDDIYKFLNDNIIKSDFATNQVKEEILKANLIEQDNIWSEQIFKVEDDSFLKGEISFLLEYAKNGKSYEYEKFKNLSDKFLLLFSKRDDLLRRALLTQGEYQIWDGRTSSLGWVPRYTLLYKDNEWKVALRKKHAKLIEAIFNLLEKAKDIKGSREEKLNKIIEKYKSTNDFRVLLIDKENLEYCQQKRFCLSEDGKFLYLLEKKRVVGKNYKKHSV